MRSSAFVGGWSLFKCCLKRLELALEISLPNSRVCPGQLDEVRECIETLGRGACRNTQNPDILPGTVSKGDLVCDLAGGLGTRVVDNKIAYSLYIFIRLDGLDAYVAFPLRGADRALLLMLDEVVLDERLAGVTLPSDLRGRTGL